MVLLTIVIDNER